MQTFAAFFKVSFYSQKRMVMRTLILSLFSSLVFFIACTGTTESKPSANQNNPALPPGTISAIVAISDLNCWVEQGQFLVTGVCDNGADEWQKIWLTMIPMAADGQVLKVNGDTSSMFATFSDAVPPRGRTSFFVSWPLTAFSGTPDTCIVKGAAALPLTAGPILVAGEKSGVKIMMPATPDDTVTVEKAWQVNVMVENPLDMNAAHPKVEMLLYGKDQRLWFATVLDPDDPQQKNYVNAERGGSMEPKEKRRIGANVFYDNLPQALKAQKIGRVEFQPFEARQ